MSSPITVSDNQTHLPQGTSVDAAGAALSSVVDHNDPTKPKSHHDVSHGIHWHPSVHSIEHVPYLHKLIPGLEDLAVKHHVGNYVIKRDTKEKFFESMPIYARIGMHLLFSRESTEEGFPTNKKIEAILREQSVKEGVHFDQPDSAKNIASFIATYNLGSQLNELLESDPTKYRTMNEFFYRKLKEGARPVQNPEPAGICSAADSRLTVYNNFDLAKKFWVKGAQFTVGKLLNLNPDVPAEKAQLDQFENCGLAIFRLAPADYHRFHSPIDGEVGDITKIDGQYYTVNPQAVNLQGFDVFTANTRQVLYMNHTTPASGSTPGKQWPVAFVAVGALLVGSIQWTNGGQKGNTVKKGEELGYFQYGGSTIIALFPQGLIEFDEDLVENSTGSPPTETLVKVGYSIGRTPESALV